MSLEGNTLYKEKARVRVRNDDGEYENATIVRQHRNGDLTVKFNETGKIARKVRKDRVQTAEDDEDCKRDDQSENESLDFEIETLIKFRDEKGDWIDGRIHKVRSNGKFDVRGEGEANDVMKNVARRDLRKRSLKQKDIRDNVERHDEDSDEEKRMVKKRKARKKREMVTSEDESDDSSDRQRRFQTHRGMRTLFRVNQLVEFEDKSGRIRRGWIQVVNRDDRTCDIIHENDREKISKRIPFDVIQATSAYNRFFGGRNRNMIPIQVNTHVYYRTKDGFERKGIVLNISQSSGKPVYDVEDLLDGTMIKSLDNGRLRVVPWLDYSLPSFNNFPKLPNFSFFSTPILRRGMNVRFRTKRNEWQDGMIRKVQANGCCLIDFYGRNGEKQREEVKNVDIDTRMFRMPFYGMFDNVLNHLTLPTLQLNSGMLKIGNAVEVSNGVKTFLGTILSLNEMDQTYTIQYEDGRKEKSVSKDRVRVSLRRLQIGTEVEMIVEGPCKEISTLDGEVAWIHHDEKVAVRINGGHNDVFAQVCTHALMVDGKPAFTAPLSSTWLELYGYYCNFGIEMGIYGWFFWGLLREFDDMVNVYQETSSEFLENIQHMTVIYNSSHVEWEKCWMHNSTSTDMFLLIPSVIMATDRVWLLLLLITKVIASVVCVYLVLSCIRSKVSALQDEFIDLKEYQQERVLRRHLATAMGYTLVVTYLTLVDYASFLNRFDRYCLLTDTHLSFDELAFRIDPFALHIEYISPVQRLLNLGAMTTFNLFRGVTFYVLLFAFPTSGTNFLRRLVFLVPSILLTTVLCAIGLAAVHIFYYVQKNDMMKNDRLDMTRSTDLAVSLLGLSLWFIYSGYNLIAAAGRFSEIRLERHRTSRNVISDEVLNLAERGEFGLQAQREALVTKVEQRQDELGIWKLTILRIHRHLLVHILAAVIAIYIDVTLRHEIKKEDESSVVQNALAFHLALSITWLLISLITGVCALTVRQQMPELLAYILDV
ncbi:hypothetical protein Plhal304r1_c004g0017691 [Plasmopara halstedii]